MCILVMYHDLEKPCHSVDHNKQLLHQVFKLSGVILSPLLHLNCACM